MDVHIKLALKKCVWKLFNHHRKGQAQSIGLFGSRRSGTTLLAQALGKASAMKIVDQPLSIFTADLVQKRYIPLYAGGYIYDPDNDELECLRDYFRKIEAGILHVAEPWRVWERDYHFLTNRILYKFTDAHALVHELEKIIPLKTLVLFRHPVPQSLSCIRRGWAPRQGKFFEQDALLEKFFDRGSILFIKDMAKKGSCFQRHLLTWFVENAPLFKVCMNEQYACVTYEDLIKSPEFTLRRICNNFNLDYSESMAKQLFTVSRSSTYKKSGSEISRYIKDGSAGAILTDWCDKLTPNEEREVFDIFDALHNPVYVWNKPMPKRVNV